MDELLLRVRTGIGFRQCPQLGIRTEDQIDAGAAPPAFTRCAIGPFKHLFGVRQRLPVRAHVEQVDEEVVAERSRPLGEDPMLGLSEVCVQRAHAAHQHRHLGRGERQQLRAVEQQFLGRDGVRALLVVAEAVRDRFEHGKGFHVGLCLRGVRAARCEGNIHGVAGIPGGYFNAGATRQHDQVGHRDFLAAGLRAIERALDAFELAKHLGQLIRLVDLPVLLRREANARAVGAATLVGAAERGRRGPGGRDQFRDGQPGRQDRALESGGVLVVDQGMINGGNGVLPDQLFGRHFWAEIARTGSHVAVGQLEPGAGKGVGKFVRILVEAPCDRPVDRVHAHRHVRRGHDDRHPLRRIVRGRRHVAVVCHLRRPLMGARRAFRQFPLVAEQHVQIAHVPLRRGRRPRAFEAAADLVAAFAAAEAALPAQPLLGESGCLGCRPDQRRIAGTVAFSEGVPAAGERNRFFIVHRHARERLAHVAAGPERIRVAAGAFRVDVDQPHLHGSKRVFEVPLAGIACAVIQPLFFVAPVDVQLRRPDVLAPAGETEGLESHRFQRDVARENEEVGPGDFLAVLLLDRPQQPARLVEVDVVGPAVEGSETLVAVPCAATTVTGAISPCTVPRHANEEGAVVTVIRRPPVLRVGHQGLKVLLHGRQVEAPEFFGVVEACPHWADLRDVLVQDFQRQLVRPPVPDRLGATGFMMKRTLRV